MKNRFWSDNPYDWGIIPLCYEPVYYERKESMTDEQKIKNKIEAFFNDLNEQHKVTVTHVCLNWIEHFENGKHDKYFLSNFDVDIKL